MRALQEPDQGEVARASVACYDALASLCFQLDAALR
jgi:hypothetical protein